MWVKKKGKEIPYLRLAPALALDIKSAEEKPSRNAPSPKIFREISIFNPRGVRIFELDGVGGFGSMDDPDQMGYEAFLIFDRWIGKRTFSRFYIRQGLNASILMEQSEDGVPTGDYERIKNARCSLQSLTVLSEDGLDLEQFRKIGFQDWNYEIHPGNEGLERFLALSYLDQGGDLAKKDFIWPGNLDTLIFEKTIDIR